MSQEQVVVEHAIVCRRCDGLVSEHTTSSPRTEAEQRAKEDPENFFPLAPGGKATYRSVTLGVHGYSCD